MKLLIRFFIFFIFSLFPFIVFVDSVFALETVEFFTTNLTYDSDWQNLSNLLNSTDSQYASIIGGRLTSTGNTGESFNIPIGATINSVSVKIYENSSGNSGSSNAITITSNGSSETCNVSPSFLLNNITQTIIFNEASCGLFSKIATVPKLNSSHFGWYFTNSGIKNASIDAISMWADYSFAPATLNAELTPGTVWEWTDVDSTPIKKEGLENMISVSTGSNHNLALKKDGTVWAWGNNQFGQLGNGETGTSNTVPMQVKNSDGQGYLTDVKAVAAGNNYSMVLKDDGTVWIWGFNGSGIRGTDNNSNNLLLPNKVKYLSLIVAIAAGKNHSLALTSEGKVFAWGINDQGQVKTFCYFSTCGNSIRYPKQVFSDSKSIVAGDYHSLAVKIDGTVWGWGRFSAGQLGSFNGDYSGGSPIQIPGISGVKKVWAKNTASMALVEDGKVFGWGGGRMLPYDANPRRIEGLNNAKMIDVGTSSSFSAMVGTAVDENGDVWIWDAENSKGLAKLPFFSNIKEVAIGGQMPNLAVVKMSEATSTPTPTITPTPTPISKVPLILIPGIAGSYLKTTDPFVWNEDDGHDGTYFNNYGANEEVWINPWEIGKPGDDDYLDVLRLNQDGVTSLVNLVPSGKLWSDYDDVINFFINNGYELDKTIFTFPYDWRKDLSNTLISLDHLINTIRYQTGSQKVDIVAHSMGGLVARNYISNESRASNIGKLFTLGTPHLGSVKLLKALVYGDDFGPSRLYGSIKLNPNEIKDIIQNFTGGFELLPSQKYFDFYTGNDLSHPYPFVDARDVDGNGVTGKLNYQQIKTMLTNLNSNTYLFVPAESFHNLDSNLINTKGVDIINIVGSGVDTLGQIIEKTHKDFSGNSRKQIDEIKVNGDGTVPIFSASLVDQNNNKSLLGDARIFYVNQEHGNLITSTVSSSALNIVKKILNEDDQFSDNATNLAYPLSGIQLSVYSPVNIHAYLEDQHTGPIDDGDYEVNIPDSSYDTLEDDKFIWLPPNGNYKIKFEATDRGSFDFKIRKYVDGIITQEILYKDIPLTVLTKAETQVNTPLDTFPIIRLDEDGDGNIDQDINFSSNLIGNIAYDQISPKTEIILNGIEGNNDWYKSDVRVTLRAQDDMEGSGILKTEYSLDNGRTINAYVEPFVISSEKINKLKFRSVDNAGNEEDPRETEIKIDKTPPQVSIDAAPKIIWPPSNKMVDVKILGSSFDINLFNEAFDVDDEYGKTIPVINDFGQTIKLQASRDGEDLDGRKYIIKVNAEDLAGNTSQAQVNVVVPHDQGNN
jgi:pimeloyl-ACP methyl ester carboxylesterase